MRFVVDSTLQVQQPRTSVTRKEFATRLISGQTDLTPVEHTLQGYIYHSNYLEYLENCWATHHEVVLTPDILWYTILCELALLVSKSPDKYRSLFTASQDKQEISVQTDNMVVLPLQSIMDRLKGLVPEGFADTFLRGFSTSSADAEEARYAAFADMVSPYYSYSMYLCGISAVTIIGTSEDYNDIYRRISYVYKKFGEPNEPWFGKVFDVMDKICRLFTSEADESFVKSIFQLKRCGSGSQVEAYGWFTDLFREQPRVRYVRNFSTHISNVSYKNLSTEKSYQMKQGLFQSFVRESVLVPRFGRIIYEKAAE